MIHRYSSRRANLANLLPELLPGARSYDRIAGFFSSSILEVAGEAIDAMAKGAVVRMVCNSHLDPMDVRTARAAHNGAWKEWCASLPADFTPAWKDRLHRLHDLLVSGRLKVRVLADQHFGLIHGKAGVVTAADGRRVCFLGSANESRSAWFLNYELLWIDEDPEGVDWVQEEFEALWGHPQAMALADAVEQDVDRLARREMVATVDDWKAPAQPDPASPVIELPVYRRENGLWAHQKYFVKLAFDQHRNSGARLLLADQVGLGKTIQLALAAKLMALWGDGKVLILAPKSLLTQWQDELWSLLEMPSAVWKGRFWEDEQGVQYAPGGLDELLRCPRKVGIISTGLVVHSPEVRQALSTPGYECVILDEAHRARRRNLGVTHRNESAEPNNLLQFLRAIAPNTRSLLLATATPVQLDPIEAWDLLEALNRQALNNEGHVLGTRYSNWVQNARMGLDYIMGVQEPPDDLASCWEWMRDPLPPAEESRAFDLLRRSLTLGPERAWAQASAINSLQRGDRQRIVDLARDFFRKHNPYIRHIVRRTREYLENTLDPSTNEPYLPRVTVRLFGDREDQAVRLPVFLQDAYNAAEEFCNLLKARGPEFNSGFLRTILLRRVGSSIEAGQSTAKKLLRSAADVDEEDDDTNEQDTPIQRSRLYPLKELEEEALRGFLQYLQSNRDEDPKLREVQNILMTGAEGTGPWIDRGCIVFTQYYDSAFWIASRLSQLLPGEPIPIYTGASRSGIIRDSAFTRLAREVIKAGVKNGEYRVLVGTDAASEGLNLQRLGTLINLDLPWNPTRLEQRKGRIQRIGQIREEVYIYNLRYRESVEDRVHELLSGRLEDIYGLFGQLPDTLEDVWISVALNDEAEALRIIDQVPRQHPFAMRWDHIESVDWESCSRVLDSQAQLEVLRRGW